MVQGIVLRMAMLFVVITIGINSITLLIGHFIPAEMLSAATASDIYSYNFAGFVLIDLNRRLHIDLSMPAPEAVFGGMLDRGGQEAIIMTQGTDTQLHLYLYNLITNTLTELSTIYTDPDSGDVVHLDSVPQWSRDGTTMWNFDLEHATIYRLDVASNVWQRIIVLPDGYAPPRQMTQGLVPITTSPDETEIALTSSDTIYVFNTDGSNLRQYVNPVAGDYSYATWSLDEQQLYIYGYINLNNSVFYNFRILDLNSGEINAYTSDLQVYRPTPCPQDQTRWVYVDADANHHGQIFNSQTGERQDLSLLPDLTGQPIQELSWTPNCEWIVVTIGNPDNSNSLNVSHRPIYLVSRDEQQVYLVSDSGSILNWIDDDSFLLTESQQPAPDIIYEVDFNDGLNKVPLIQSFSPGDYIVPIEGDPYQLLVFDFDQSVGLRLLDVRTSVEIQLSTNATPQAALWRWDN